MSFQGLGGRQPSPDHGLPSVGSLAGTYPGPWSVLSSGVPGGLRNPAGPPCCRSEAGPKPPDRRQQFRKQDSSRGRRISFLAQPPGSRWEPEPSCRSLCEYRNMAGPRHLARGKTMLPHIPKWLPRACILITHPFFCSLVASPLPPL